MTSILVVDDEPHVLRLLEISLRRAGYTVSIANNGVQAFDKINGCPPDVLVSDIEMAGMTGMELCKKIEQEMPERAFPIYIMTSRPEMEYRNWYGGIRDLHFLEKPVSSRKLINSIQEHGHFPDDRANMKKEG